jgi:branched-chain amino acid transport system ATP-binding protein
LASNITISGIHAAYGAVRVIEDVSMSVGAGETVVLLGTNGNGKSTLIKCIMGMVRPTAGRIIAEIDGQKHDLVGRSTEEIVDLGIALVPEGRRLFPKLTVEENLLLGAWHRNDRSAIRHEIEVQFERFPVLGERRRLPAGQLSGGEQQVLAIGRALLGRPRLLVLDEPSLGLAPRLVEEVFDLIASLHDEGLTILLVEQNAVRALQLASRGYVLETGQVTISGDADELLVDPKVQAAYLGT